MALLYGEATPSYFTDDAVTNATVVAFRKKVHVTTDDERFGKDQATVTIEFDDGSTLEKHVEHAIGSLENPLTDDGLRKKFLDQVSRRIGDARAENAYVAFRGIGNMTDVGQLRTLY